MVVDRVVETLSEHTGLAASTVREDVEVPPRVELGDYAYPCFRLAGEKGNDPVVLAGDVASRVSDLFHDVTSDGPYVNITLSPAEKVRVAEEPVAKDEDDKIIVEFPSPNTNKPLHLGHALNMAIGQSMVDILRFLGNDVVVENLYNDRGIHISKSMVAYRREGDGETPENTGRKPDHFVGDYYVRYGEIEEADPSVSDEAQEMLQDWESGDAETRSLWNRMRSWCLQGIRSTIGDYGVQVDRERFESDIYEDGRSLVRDGLDRGVFEEDEDGAIIADLSEEDLGTKHVLRSDGTTVYLTQDLGLAKTRADDTDPDRIVHVVGNEQEYHFQCLFSILDRLGFEFADDLHHLSYGMLRLSEGTMSSREGTAIYADDVRAEMISRAKDEIEDRHEAVDNDDLAERSETIGMGALKYYLLRTDPKRDVTFDPEASLSFTGETGPYIQYTYARITSMLEESEESEADYTVLSSVEERKVLRLLIGFEEQVRRAARSYNPSSVANYALELAQAFNEFYHEHRVLVDDEAVRGARRELCGLVAERLETSLSLLGIDVVEEM